MEMHFGKQWRQLKKCIIQCQETAQGSKPEPVPGAHSEASAQNAWHNWVGEEGDLSKLHSAQLSCMRLNPPGDTYF